MEEEKKKTTFLFVFLTYLPDVIIPFFQVFLVFGVVGSVKSMLSGYSLDAEFNSTSNEYPLGILLMGLATPKTRNT